MDQRLRALGWITAFASIAGSALALVVIGWPEQVPDTRWSYPFAATPYIASQVFFAVQHTLLLPGLVAVRRLAPTDAGRATRIGLALTVAFTAVSGVIELAAISGARASTTSGTADALGAAYGVMSLGLGLGFVMAGVGLWRRPVLPGPLGQRIYLVIGVWTFFPMLPSLFLPLVWGRITIGIWYLMYAVIGLGLVKVSTDPRRATDVGAPA